MDKQLQDYYENRFETMCTRGWKDLIEDVERMMEASNSLDGVVTEKDLNFSKGEISIMRWILTLEDISRAAYEDLKNESDV